MDGLLGVAGMIMNIVIRGHSRPTFSASKFFYVMKGLGDLAEKTPPVQIHWDARGIGEWMGWTPLR